MITDLPSLLVGLLTNQDREVGENTRSRVKINIKLTNLKKLTRIEGYCGE